MASNLKPATSRDSGTPPHSLMVTGSGPGAAGRRTGLVHEKAEQPPRLPDAAFVRNVKKDLHSPSGFPKNVVKYPRVGLRVMGKTAAAAPDGGADPGTFVPDGKLHLFLGTCPAPMDQGIVHRFVEREEKEHTLPSAKIPENGKDPLPVRSKLFNRTEADFHQGYSANALVDIR